jgi:hypothetical protein
MCVMLKRTRPGESLCRGQEGLQIRLRRSSGIGESVEVETPLRGLEDTFLTIHRASSVTVGAYHATVGTHPGRLNFFDIQDQFRNCTAIFRYHQ